VLRCKAELARIAIMDRTLKMRAFTDTVKNDVPNSVRVEESNKSQDIAKKDALLEEERSKSLELLKTIVQLRESLKQEQARTTELQIKLNRLDGVEQNQLIRKNAQLEEEQKKYLDQIKINEQLRESLKQEQASYAEMAKKTIELQARLRKLAEVEENQLVKKDAQLEEEKKNSLEYIRVIEQLRESIKQDQAKKTEMVNKTSSLEDKVKELSVVLSKISSLATGGKLDSNG
jgi:hypothetical protein